jgi:hypothetical protein
MSERGKLIDDVTRPGLAIAPKKLGYRKSGRTFYQVHDARTEIVNVQASKSNMGDMGDTGTFTINLGVYFPAVATITNALPITGVFPKEYDSTVRKRLGMLVDGDRDFWWTVDSDAN